MHLIMALLILGLTGCVSGGVKLCTEMPNMVKGLVPDSWPKSGCPVNLTIASDPTGEGGKTGSAPSASPPPAEGPGTRVR
ncbi:hypothetical protein [Candidatus Nitrospira bockiana]